MNNEMSYVRHQGGWIKWVIALIIAVLLLIFAAMCQGNKPLTSAQGSTAADAVQGALTTLIETEGASATDIADAIDGIFSKHVDRVKTRKGITVWVDAFCEQLITLIQNRIRSAPNSQHARVWREVLRMVREKCGVLQQLEEPPEDD